MTKAKQSNGQRFTFKNLDEAEAKGFQFRKNFFTGRTDVIRNGELLENAEVYER